MFSFLHQSSVSFSWGHYSVKSISPVSGIQTSVLCLTLSSSFLKPKRPLCPIGSDSHLYPQLQAPLLPGNFLRLYSLFSPILPCPYYQVYFLIEKMITDHQKCSCSNSVFSLSQVKAQPIACRVQCSPWCS